jgi:inner membrane protein
MPTVLTHALAGVALAPSGPAGIARGRLAICLVGLSVLPDVDVLAFAVGIPYEHMLGHRGFTHSLLFAMMVGWVVARFGFPAIPLYSRSWWHLFWLLVVSAASHGCLDALTNGGLGIGFFIPFDSQRYFFPIRPLVVSPIGIDAFFGGPVRRVLGSEFIYVWIPLGIVFALGLANRKRRGATD